MKIGQSGRGTENKEMDLLVEVRFLEHDAASLISNTIAVFYSNTPEISDLSPRWSSCTGEGGCALAVPVPPHIPLLGGTGNLLPPVIRLLLRAQSTTDLCYSSGKNLYLTAVVFMGRNRMKSGLYYHIWLE